MLFQALDLCARCERNLRVVRSMSHAGLSSRSTTQHQLWCRDDT